MRSVVLVGMMGCGKTTVGRELAHRVGFEFLDTDQVLQAKLGRTVSGIFRVYGEDAFRDHETSLLRSIGSEGVVVATGGGMVMRERNWAEMRRIGAVVFLDVDRDVLLERLSAGRKRRPLLAEDDWEKRFDELLERRRPLYEQADLSVRIGREDPEEVARNVQELVAAL